MSTKTRVKPVTAAATFVVAGHAVSIAFANGNLMVIVKKQATS